MRHRPFADAVALWQPDPSLRKQARARLERLERMQLFDLAGGWLVGLQCLPGTDADQVFSAEAGVIVPQGADLLAAQASGGRIDWPAIAEDASDRTGYCSRSTSGDFAVARLQPGGRIAAMQTHATLMPLLLAGDARMLAWSTSLDLIALSRPAPPECDRAILASWCNAFPIVVEGRSVVKGVAEYLRGSRVTAAPGAAPQAEHCDDEFLGPELAHAELGKAECAAWLRDIVLNNLRRDLSPDGVNLLALSCGRDSTTLASLVHQRLRLPLKTASLLPADPATRAHELAYAAQALKGLPEQDRIVIDWTDRGYQAKVLSRAPDTLQPVLHPMLCEIGRILENRPVDVYFGGEFCDELIGGESVLAEWLADLGLWRGLRRTPIATQRAPLGWKQLLRERYAWLDRLLLRLRGQVDPRQLAPPFARELREEVGRLLTAIDAGPRTAPQLMLQRYRHAYVPSINMNWAACAAHGIRRSFPIVSRESLSLLWTTRARHRLSPRSKELFCAAFSQDVPARSLSRGDKGLWGKVLPAAGFEARDEFSDPARLLESEPRAHGDTGAELRNRLVKLTQDRLRYRSDRFG